MFISSFCSKLLIWVLVSFSDPYDLDLRMFKVVPEVPKPLLIFLNSSFFILFGSNVYFFVLLQIIDLSPCFLPFTLGSLYMFLFVAFIFSSIFQPYSTISMSILITSILNCASDRLATSSLLSCGFFWSFDLFFHLGLFFFFVSVHLLPIKGSSLRCSPGGGIIYFLCFIKSGLHQHVLPLKISFNNDLFCVFKAIHLKRTIAYLNQVNLG